MFDRVSLSGSFQVQLYQYLFDKDLLSLVLMSTASVMLVTVERSICRQCTATETAEESLAWFHIQWRHRATVRVHYYTSWLGARLGIGLGLG